MSFMSSIQFFLFSHPLCGESSQVGEGWVYFFLKSPLKNIIQLHKAKVSIVGLQASPYRNDVDADLSKGR